MFRTKIHSRVINVLFTEYAVRHQSASETRVDGVWATLRGGVTNP